MTHGEELVQRREALGLTETEAAAILGVSFWTLHNWEHGKREIPEPMWRVLTFLLDGAERRLLAGEGVDLRWHLDRQDGKRMPIAVAGERARKEGNG